MGTHNDRRHAADICREHGWGVGTQLAGSDGFGTTTIEITALGNQVMLARTIGQNGRPASYARDRPWRLSDRDWKKIA
ncbi:DUF7241 domain-containing protein [Methylobacterium sp. C25]|uniref:DUF7241 domain-containing protein n=1 Tax=Methylobacterium sp. C25 TaxID=2721622 RepID=UPI003FA37D14